MQPVFTLGTTIAAETLRNTQTVAKGTVELARQTIETSRLMAAAALYVLVGTGMITWSTEPERVDTLFDVSLMRNPPQELPAAPADTTWEPAIRTLSTTALPLYATRLSAWRIAPGGMPEQLATGETGATSVLIRHRHLDTRCPLPILARSPQRQRPQPRRPCAKLDSRLRSSSPPAPPPLQQKGEAACTK